MPNKKINKILLTIILIVLLIILIILFQRDKEEEELMMEEEIISLDSSALISSQEDQLLEAPTPIDINPDIIIPDYSSDLDDLIASIDNEFMLAAYLNKHFSFEEVNDTLALAPEQFLNRQSGDALDVAVLAAQLLKSKLKMAGIIRFDYPIDDDHSQIHAVCIFRGDGPATYLTLNEEQTAIEIYQHGSSFADLIINEEKRLNTRIDRYFYSEAEHLDLSQPLGPYSWQDF